MSARGPVRVLIVEDSAVVRTLLRHVIGRDPRLEVAEAVGSAEEALRLMDRVRPDVISMDIHLPGMDGLEATRRIMAEHPTPIVVIASSVEDERFKISMNALRAGALAVIEKPPGPTDAAYARMADEICTQLAIMSQVKVVRQRFVAKVPPAPVSAPARPSRLPRRAPALLAIATSTGGPPALAKLLGALPADFALPILVVQHMGAAFLAGFASWLDGVVPMRVVLGQAGDTPQPGTVHVAPGQRDMVWQDGRLGLAERSLATFQSPSATALFRSLVPIAPQVIAILLTGMGEDGAVGMLDLHRAGAYTIAEDESTAAVYGMPAAAVALNAVTERLPLDLIGPRLLQLQGAG